MVKKALVMSILLLLLVACGKSDPDLIPASDIPPAEEAPPVEEPVPPTENVTYTKAPVGSSAAYAQAEQLSIAVVRTFALGSGLGENFTLSNKTRTAILADLDLTHPATQGEWLMIRTYANGPAKLPKGADKFLYPTNWESWRWFATSEDKRTPIAAAEELILAELFAAELLSNAHAAAETYDANLLAVSATRQAEFLAYNGKSGKDFVDLDATGKAIEGGTIFNQFRMLNAYARIARAVDADQSPGTLRESEAVGYANQIFNQLLSAEKANPTIYANLSSQALRGGLESFTLFATITDSLKWQTLALSHIRKMAAALQSRIGDDGAVRDAGDRQLVAQAAAVTGLTYAYRATADEAYHVAATHAWDALEKLWDPNAGLYKPYTAADSYTYAASDFAEVFLALNSANHFLEAKAEDRYATFFTNAVLSSGMLPAQYVTVADHIPETKENLRAPVYLTEVRYDPSTAHWEVTDPTFTTAEGMALARALLQNAEDKGGDYRIADFGMPVPATIEKKSSE